MEQKIHLVGGELFCPDCRRWLTRVNEDGSIWLNAAVKAGGSAFVEVSDEDEGVPVPDEMVVTQATCMRKRCQLKRWLREKVGRDG